MEGNKLVIPGRPYNPNSNPELRSVNSNKITEEVKVPILPKNPKVESPIKPSQFEIKSNPKNPTGIVVPNGSKSDASSDFSKLDKNSLTLIKMKIESMRDTIRNNLEKRINAMRADTREEMNNLTKIEDMIESFLLKQSSKNEISASALTPSLNSNNKGLENTVYNIKKVEKNDIMTKSNIDLNSSISSIQSFSNISLQECEKSLALRLETSLLTYATAENNFNTITLSQVLRGMGFLYFGGSKIILTGGSGKKKAFIYDIFNET